VRTFFRATIACSNNSNKEAVSQEYNLQNCAPLKSCVTVMSKKGGPPKARICYICGRQYMIHSFQIHVEQCRELFEKREALKPPKERFKCPTDPMIMMGGMKDHMDIDAVNAASQQAWSNSLAQCEFCGRSFLPEKLPVHNRSCTASNPSRRVTEVVKRGKTLDVNEATNYTSDGIAVSSDGIAGTTKQRNNFSSVEAGFAGGADAMYSGGGGIQCVDCGRKFNEVAYPK
jgi:hypothetical protein